MPDSELYKGHRKRLKSRFIKAPLRTLDDYEILEMVLFNVYPRRDTKDIAKKLLKEFGSLTKLFLNDHREIAKNDLPDGLKLQIKLIQDLFSRIVLESNPNQPVHILDNWSAVLNYLKLDMGYCEREYFKILFLNTKNALVAEQNFDSGTVNKAVVFPREIVKYGLKHNASGVILVHNHPSGDCSPSRCDIRTTKLIKNALQTVDINMHDHIIVAHDRHYSMRNNNIL